MKLSQFKYTLPKDLFAEKPSKLRDEARLLVVDRKTGAIEHRLFKDLIDYVDEGDVMVLNNTKVIPARLFGEKEGTQAKIELLLLKRRENNVFSDNVRSRSQKVAD